jgi:predicted peptidase
MKRTANIFFILQWMLLALPSAAQVHTARQVRVTSNLLGFYEYLPRFYKATETRHPVIIFMHGQGEMGNGTPSQITRVLRNGPPKLINLGQWPDSFTVNTLKHRPLVISPQFVGWPRVQDVDTLINYLIANYWVDPSRIYLTGLSMGGAPTWEYVGWTNASARRIAAIVPICGASWPEPIRATTMAANNVPVWATHNNGDPVAPVFYTNDYVARINAAPLPPTPLAKKTIFNSNSHDAWTVTYNPTFKENGLNVYEWMLQYRREFISVWQGTTNGSWETASNWSEKVVPDINTNVVINSGTVTINSNTSVRTLSVAPGATLRINTGRSLIVFR